MSAAISPYDFEDPFAQSVLTAVKTKNFGSIPGIGKSQERQSIWVEKQLKDAFMIRNPKGQTLLYCLLRFTVNDYIRRTIFYHSTVEQLATQNTNCGSTALMGFIYGEFENPRMSKDYKIKEVLKHADDFNRGVMDILSIPNYLGETCYIFYNHIIQWQQQ